MFGHERHGSIRIILIEEEILVRSALSRLVASWSFQLVGEAASKEEAVERLSRVEADIVLLSLAGSEQRDLELVRDIASLCQPTPVVVLAGSINEAFRLQLEHSGAGRIVLKTQNPMELYSAIRAMHEGEHRDSLTA